MTSPDNQPESGQEILVLDADENVRKGADRLLREAGLAVTILADMERAKDQIANRFFPVVLADLDTPTQNAAIDLIKFVRERSRQTAVIVMSRRIGFDAVAPVFRAGATDVIPKAREYVHDLRVAARRARSAVRLFSVVSGTEAGGALTEELAWIARLLGAARDLDVFSARLDEQFDRVEADPEFRETIRERLRARRTPAVARLAEALRSERFSSLLHRLESSSGSSEAAGEPAVHFCRRRIQKAFTKLELWIDRPADTLSGSELHRVRILFKRLRYACEFFRPVLGSDAGRLIGSFVGFQDCLGLHQDAVTCLHMLGGVLAETPGEIRSERFLITMGALQQVQRGIQADQRAVFAERWETARELLDVWKKVRDTRGGTV